MIDRENIYSFIINDIGDHESTLEWVDEEQILILIKQPEKMHKLQKYYVNTRKSINELMKYFKENKSGKLEIIK